jgi:hypothetical protein
MPIAARFHPAFKVFLFWALFLILHYLYEWFPFAPFKLVSGVSEAPFQHFKIAFYAYLLVSLVELAYFWRKWENHHSAIHTRLLSTMLSPWAIFLFWFFAAAVYGRLPNIPVEVIYANLALVLTGAVVVALERSLDGVAYTQAARWAIMGLFLASLVLFIAFSEALPWTDVFTEPAW